MDKTIKDILIKIEEAGYKCFIVGGYVRDYVLGIKTNDVDICTNAKPDIIIDILNLNKNTDINYGCIKMKIKDYSVDITTFRKEKNYINHTPTKIKYINNLKQDLKRRDFTCNQLLMDKNGNIIDYYNGLKDIKYSIIKCIGNTNKKLKEDPLRMLRALRFSIIYNFELDIKIIKFIKNNKDLIKNISYYRKKEELDKIIISKNRIKGLKIIKEYELCDVLDIEYDEININKDIYKQIKFGDKYQIKKKNNN